MMMALVIWSIFVCTTLIAAFVIGCMRKKKPVEQLMAKPAFSQHPVAESHRPSLAPAATASKEKPQVEHTVSIKLDNNADEADLQGPRESMSRDPMTELPHLKPEQGINEFKEEHDKVTKTPPSDKQQHKSAKARTPGSSSKKRTKEENKLIPEDVTQCMSSKSRSQSKPGLKTSLTNEFTQQSKSTKRNKTNRQLILKLKGDRSHRLDTTQVDSETPE